MSRAEFLSSTHGELLCVIHGYYERQRQSIMLSWEQVRQICYHTVISFNGSKAVSGGIKEFMRFAWDYDKDIKNVVISPDKMADTISKLKLINKVRQDEIQKKKNQKRK
jgi:hypothetical protein